MITEVLQERYTVRTFNSEKLIPEKDIEQMVQAGMTVPSQNFVYGYQLAVVSSATEKGRSVRDKLWQKHLSYKHCDQEGKPVWQYLNSIRSAPLNFVYLVSAKKDAGADTPSRPEHYKDLNVPEKVLRDIEHESLLRHQVRDAMISATSLMLQAEQLGYGTAFSAAFNGEVNHKELFKELGFPDSHYPLVVVSVGVPMTRQQVAPKGYSGLEIDFNCIGSPKKSMDFLPLNDHPNAPEKAVIRALDNGPKKRTIEKDRVNYL